MLLFQKFAWSRVTVSSMTNEAVVKLTKYDSANATRNTCKLLAEWKGTSARDRRIISRAMCPPVFNSLITFDTERAMQKRRLVTLTGAALCVAALAACSDLTTPFGRSAAATYSLQTVNGYQLPYTFNQGGSTIAVQGDTYVLNNDYTYNEITNETVSNGYQGSNVSQTEYGTWSQNNSSIRFTPRSSTQGSYSSYTGYLDGGGTLSIALNGTTSVYYAQ